MGKTILWSVSEGIGRLTFNRPEHANSMGLASCADMEEGIARMTEPNVRVVVITGNGKFFNAGGDISEFLENQGKLDQLVDEILQYTHPLFRTLASLPIPVISAVNGPLGGAGIGFALCADFVLASDTVKLRGGYCGIALSPDMGSSYFLTRRVGAAKAKEIFMLNRALDAEECLRLGIVDQVYPAGQLASAVDSLARELASGPTSSFGRVKELCDKAFSHDLKAHLDLEHQLLVQSARSADCKEGIASFIEGRTANFVGR
jgi:2-(1,2-epoxy-1,2-dihydrophenyl)acetyl-CoA isomerase